MKRFLLLPIDRLPLRPIPNTFLRVRGIVMRMGSGDSLPEDCLPTDRWHPRW